MTEFGPWPIWVTMGFFAYIFGVSVGLLLTKPLWRKRNGKR